jgi:hypothetical protein
LEQGGTRLVSIHQRPPTLKSINKFVNPSPTLYESHEYAFI